MWFLLMRHIEKLSINNILQRTAWCNWHNKLQNTNSAKTSFSKNFASQTEA